MYVWTATKKLEKESPLYSNKLEKNRLEESLPVRLEGGEAPVGSKTGTGAAEGAIQLSTRIGRKGPI